MAQDSTELAHTARLTDMVNSLNQDFAKKTSEGAAIKAKDLEVQSLKAEQAELHDRCDKLETEKQNLQAQLVKQQQSKVSRDEKIRALRKQLDQTSKSHTQSMQQCTELQNELNKEKENYATKLTDAARRCATDRKVFLRRECAKRAELAEKRAADAEKELEVLKHPETPLESRGGGDESHSGATDTHCTENSTDDAPSSTARCSSSVSQAAAESVSEHDNEQHESATKEDDEVGRLKQQLMEYQGWTMQLEAIMLACPNCSAKLRALNQDAGKRENDQCETSIPMEDIDSSSHLEAETDTTQMQLDDAEA